MFNFEKVETQATLLFMLKADHPLSATHGHRPQATFTIPKFISSPPVCPEGTDDLDACDAWARFALGNFFSERCMDKLVGVTLWDKWVYWRDEVTIQKQAVRTDLGNLDFVALEVLSRIQLATKSRRLMSSLAGDNSSVVIQNISKEKFLRGAAEVLAEARVQCTLRDRE